MNRADFQELALLRLQEAQVLLQQGCPAGAYYLAGYAVEFALKACIARLTKQYDFPDKDRVNQSYVHNLKKLIDVAGLNKELLNRMNEDIDFFGAWNTVKDWSEKSRYDKTIEKKEAETLINAITDENIWNIAMVKEILVNEYIEEAINLINELDNNNIKIDSALWYYFDEAEEWRFIIATPLVDEKGLFEAYKIIGNIIKKNNIFYHTPLTKLTLMSPNDPLIKILKLGVQTGPKLAKIRFQNNFINNVYIEDALIYRL